jgi:hypothetical protein
VDLDLFTTAWSRAAGSGESAAMTAAAGGPSVEVSRAAALSWLLNMANIQRRFGWRAKTWRSGQCPKRRER